MKRLLVCLLICGCFEAGSAVPDRESHNPKPRAETIFTVLVESATNDKAYYQTTDDVRRTVRRLLVAKSITQGQADAVDKVLGMSRRPVTAEDLRALEGIQ